MSDAQSRGRAERAHELGGVVVGRDEGDVGTSGVLDEGVVVLKGSEELVVAGTADDEELDGGGLVDCELLVDPAEADELGGGPAEVEELGGGALGDAGGRLVDRVDADVRLVGVTGATEVVCGADGAEVVPGLEEGGTEEGEALVGDEPDVVCALDAVPCDVVRETGDETDSEAEVAVTLLSTRERQLRVALVVCQPVLVPG